MSSIIDAEGNINANLLSKELQQALEDDVRFKQTDNMKKRAVKVSTDYNEFKNMVACAHLKKLTSKEVESLSHVKKGWQKSVQKDKSASAVVLTKELETSELLSNNAEVKTVLASTSKKFKPKFAMEIERDLRRLSPGREQLIYLFRVGLKRAKSLLATGADTDLLETIIKLLTYNKEELVKPGCEVAGSAGPVLMCPAETEGATKSIEVGDDVPPEATESATTTTTKAADRTDEELLADPWLRVKWLRAITEFDKFDLTRRFLAKDLVNEVVSMLRAYAGTTPEEGEALAARYLC